MRRHRRRLWAWFLARRMAERGVRTGWSRALGAATVLGVALVAIASSSAQGPPLPSAADGARVEVVGRGVPTPTAFAFGRGQVFVSGFGDEEGKTPGAIYVLRGGRALKVPGTTGSAGLAWGHGTLYATTAPRSLSLVAYERWDGTRFAARRVVWRAPKRFPGLNGIAIGPDHRLYAGVSLSDDADTKKSTRPYGQSVISMRLDGSDVRTVATGLRQPWQLAFVQGIPRPFVTVLGQENLGKRQPPDYVILARDGDDYGFPACNWSKPKACSGFATPVALFPAHSSPTGIAARGKTLYVALFNGSRGPEVVTLPAKGGRSHPFLRGFPAPVVAVGATGNHVYAGDLTGSIYRVSP
jgi:glucose/arabinose dehydrogenase